MNNNYLITERYELDFTGTNPDNFIENEVHEYNPLQTNRIVPRAGSFYHKTTKVYLNNKELIWMVDYFPELYDQKVSELANKEASRLIRIADTYGGGELKLSYQTPGSHGNYIDTIKDLIEAIKNGTGNITWSSIRNKPDYYPPLQHTHSAYELYGYDALVYGTYAIATAIKDCYTQMLNKINVYYRDLMFDVEILKGEVTLTNQETKNALNVINSKVDGINQIYNDFIAKSGQLLSVQNFNNFQRAINQRLDDEILPDLRISLKHYQMRKNQNLNDLRGKDKGMYSQTDNGIKGKELNYPIDDARGTLFIYADNNGNENNRGGCRQVFYCYNSYDSYHRFYNGDNNTWSNWIPNGANPEDALIQYIYPHGNSAQPFEIKTSNELVINDKYPGKSVVYVPEINIKCKDNVRRWITIGYDSTNLETYGINIERTADGKLAIKAGDTCILSNNRKLSKLPDIYTPADKVTSASFRIAVYRQSFVVGGQGGGGGGVSNVDLQPIYDSLESIRADINNTINFVNSKTSEVAESVKKVREEYVPKFDTYMHDGFEDYKFQNKLAKFNILTELVARQAIVFNLSDTTRCGLYLRNDRNLYCNTQFIATDMKIESDSRLKSDLKPINVDDILSITPYQYKHKDGFYSYGVIAQDVEKYYPHAVTQSGEYKTVNYNALTAITIGALKKYVNKDNRAIGEIIEVLSGSKIANDYVELNGQELSIDAYPEFVSYLNESDKTQSYIKGNVIKLPKCNTESGFTKCIKVR